MLTADEMRGHAAQMTRLASDIVLPYFRGTYDINFKSDESPVTQADRVAEAAVREYLKSHLPNHGIFGEEYGFDGVEKDELWIIDPIDGTRSFLSGHPLFGILLAFLSSGVSQMGVVAMPAIGEYYVGLREQGATLNGDAIHASKVTRLDQAILYVNEGDKIYRDFPEIFQKLMASAQTRRFGYDCYPHALVAAGYADAVVDYDLQPYDFLAVSALLESAGGVMTDWSGKPLTLQSSGEVVSAATPELHKELLALLNH